MPKDPKKEILKIIADNQVVFDALKEVILSEFRDTYDASETLSNEQIGQITRARIEGVRKVEAAFAEIAKCKSMPVVPTKVNGAR